MGDNEGLQVLGKQLGKRGGRVATPGKVGLQVSNKLLDKLG